MHADKTQERNADIRRGSAAPAVVKVSRTVDAAHTEEFAIALAGFFKASETRPGWLGADVIRPPTDATGTGEWQILFRFRSEADLAGWRTSPEAGTLRAHLDALTVGEPRVERVHGMELWFSAPAAGTSPPPKWKMAILTAAVIYPFILTMPGLLSPLLGDAPQWLASLANVVIMIPLMTWLIMPAITRLLKDWLYARLPAAGEVSLIGSDEIGEEPKST